MSMPFKDKVIVYLVGFGLGTVLLTFLQPYLRSLQEDDAPKVDRDAAYGTFPLTFTDDLGRTVTLERQPRRYISLARSVTEMLFAMGLGDRLAAVTDFDTYPAEAKALRDSGATVGSLDTPNVERIVVMAPDIVIGTEFTPESVYAQLQDPPRRVAVAFRHQTYDDVLADLKQLSVILGLPGEGLRVARELEARRAVIDAEVQTIRNRPERRVLLVYNLEEDLLPGTSPGAGTWIGDLLVQCHAINVSGGSRSGWGQLSLEGLLETAPEVIIIPDGQNPDEKRQLRERIARLPAHPVWGRLPAIQQGRLVIVPPEPLSIPGPRMVEAYANLAYAIWPELME